MSELKPCPFCGSVPDIEPIEDCEYINCSNLDCIDGVYCLTTKQWNTRPIEDALRAEITRLKEENHALDQINRDIQTAAAHLDEVLAELARRDEEVAELRKQKYIPVHDTLTDAGKEYYEKCIRQEKELARLQEKLHDEMSQLEIATDLGNKRWVALNDIYENGEKHNANWCKRKAQEGLGIK